MKKSLFYRTAVGFGILLGVSTASYGQTNSPSANEQSQGNKSEKATSKDLASSVSISSDFSTLQQALQAAGLEERAKGAGPYTVFAPSNAAFDKLPTGTVSALLKPENKEKLTQLLTYHVVQGNVMAADLKDGQTLKTVGGATLTVKKQGGTVMIQDQGGNSATVVTPDIKATNGVVHAIDGVLTLSK